MKRDTDAQEDKKSRIGSSKLITATSKGQLDFKFTEGWSALDRGTSKQTIRGMGAARCACAVQSFKLLKAAGLPTHFVGQVDAVTIQVREFSVPGQASLSGETDGRVLPLEWIWHLGVKGSLLERLKSGKIDPATLGLDPKATIVDGMMLPKMFLECTTKFEPVDRHVNEEEAKHIAQLTDQQWLECWDFVSQAVRVTNERFNQVGFGTPDGKLELGLTRWGKIVGVDVMGTQDENRLIDMLTGDNYDKDILRKILKNLGWKDRLDQAKKLHPKDKSKWPPYPTLSQPQLNLVSYRYGEAAKRYSASYQRS